MFPGELRYKLFHHAEKSAGETALWQWRANGAFKAHMQGMFLPASLEAAI